MSDELAAALLQVGRLQARVEELEAEQLSEHAWGADFAGTGWRRRLATQGRDMDKQSTATVFALGTHVWIWVACISLLLMIVITVLVERMISILHHKVPKAYQGIVHKVIEEFTIMGFVSFTIVLLEGATPLSHDLFINLEFAHLVR